ncbi:MAG: hypothetical protein CVU46_15290 [Chloroflexi bacterium HGW-Chloroflexi-8]|jgi:rubrerythrin|nr:MAG: hypothetical protein CVU46_15290 [Chloroflexi bacterium HGW-Chloroflexi-8]
MSDYVDLSKEKNWMCANCNVPLVSGKVDISYLGNSFQVNLLKCPICNLVLVPEDLALGKMAEVEKSLEDK